MYNDLIKISSYEEFKELMNEDFVYFRMTGGLGNQLFGLSESYQLHKLTKKRILLDFIHNEHNQDENGSLFQDIASWGVNIQTNFNHDLTFPKVCNLGYEEYFPEQRFYTGWKPDLKSIERSGLFLKSNLPEPWRKFVRPKQRTAISLHLRFGDYLNAKSLGGNISVDHIYVRSALRKISHELRTDCVRVFSDDIRRAKRLCGRLEGFEFYFIRNRSAIEDLIDMSQAEGIIASASTFSFWASYFSKSKHVIFPEPFFFSNNDWEAKLIHHEWIQIRRSMRSRVLRKANQNFV
jgi:hypothetical protein